MIKRLKLIFFLGFVLLNPQLQAIGPYKPQIANPVPEPWRWTNFPEYDTIRISCVVKGEDGGMWMGIGNKAVYYDGYKTIPFIPDSTEIQSLIFEKDNNLLVATSKGIFRYKEGEFRKILNFSFNSQRNFLTDSNKDSWIGSDFGLIRITTKAIYCLNPQGYFEITENGSVVNTVRLELANDYRISSVQEIKFPVYNLDINQLQRIWMVVDLPGKNIATIDLKGLPNNLPVWKFMKAPALSVIDISGISENRNSVWVTSSNANIMLLQYLISEDKWKSINLKDLGGDNVQTSMLKSTDGTIWIGGHSKLYSLTSAGWKVYQYPAVTLPLSYIEIYQ
ncbi:MAG TPA: hypothetical protein VF373_06310, partial [Prolixibacteraceae bacterium]